MTRAERRRAERDKNKTATYNLTEEQLEAMVNEKIASELKRVKRKRQKMRYVHLWF